MISIGGGRRGTPGLVDLLADCHERIRRFSALARHVGEAHTLAADECIDACSRVERYFTVALPLHIQDEEESLLPRLEGLSPATDHALELMRSQHADHVPKLAAMISAAQSLRDAPGDPARHLVLATSGLELERDFLEHLVLEETVIFPAVRRLLSEAQQAEIVSELRGRRAPPS